MNAFIRSFGLVNQNCRYKSLMPKVWEMLSQIKENDLVLTEMFKQ